MSYYDTSKVTLAIIALHNNALRKIITTSWFNFMSASPCQLEPEAIQLNCRRPSYPKRKNCLKSVLGCWFERTSFSAKSTPSESPPNYRWLLFHLLPRRWKVCALSLQEAEKWVEEMCRYQLLRERSEVFVFLPKEYWQQRREREGYNVLTLS